MKGVSCLRNAQKEVWLDKNGNGKRMGDGTSWTEKMFEKLLHVLYVPRKRYSKNRKAWFQR